MKLKLRKDLPCSAIIRVFIKNKRVAELKLPLGYNYTLARKKLDKLVMTKILEC